MPALILRVALFLVAYLFILFAASFPKGMSPPPYADLVWGAVASLALLALTRAVLAGEQRSARDVGLAPDRRSIVRLLAGVALGAVVYGATMALSSLLFGPIHVAAAAWPTARSWAVVLASYGVLAAMEELGFRGYALRTLVPAIGVWPAQLSLALAFGASHLLFGWAWPAIVLGVIPSALLFGVVALRSGGLAMPIGLHASLNVAQWIVGAKEGPGIFTLSVPPDATARLTSFAPYVGLGVTLVATLVIARWPTRAHDVIVNSSRPIEAV